MPLIPKESGLKRNLIVILVAWFSLGILFVAYDFYESKFGRNPSTLPGHSELDKKPPNVDQRKIGFKEFDLGTNWEEFKKATKSMSFLDVEIRDMKNGFVYGTLEENFQSGTYEAASEYLNIGCSGASDFKKCFRISKIEVIFVEKKICSISLSYDRDVNGIDSAFGLKAWLAFAEEQLSRKCGVLPKQFVEIDKLNIFDFKNDGYDHSVASYDLGPNAVSLRISSRDRRYYASIDYENLDAMAKLKAAQEQVHSNL